MKKVIAIFLLSLLEFTPAFSYRFVCNGILANGEAREDDGCGICDDIHAARWKDPQIEVVVDDAVLPKAIKRDEWLQAVENSFSAWENISGTSLRFIKKEAHNPREFGANEGLHEIFWITKKEEWRKLVGAGEFGTLGATLPRYSCGGEQGSLREIFDADLVLNGLPHINWAMDCHDDDCISVQTTLVHELGHFFGLDHPCLLCSTSIMSARAGYDLTYPTLDDMEGIRALYPNGITGGFGFPCRNDEDCDASNRCVVDSPHRYCSKGCEDNDECQKGAVCKSNHEGQVCGFSSEASHGRGEGDNCTRTPCEEPLICAGASEPNFYCYRPCLTDDNCKEKEACITIEEKVGVCVNIKNKGDVCNHRDLCEEDLYCVFSKLTSGLCHAPCKITSSNTTGCDADETCELIEGVEICVATSDHLALDEASSEFRADDGTDPSGNAKKPTNKRAASGCQVGDLNRTNNGVFVLLVFFALLRALKRRPFAKSL